MKLPVIVDRVQPQSSKFALLVEKKATGNLELKGARSCYFR